MKKAGGDEARVHSGLACYYVRSRQGVRLEQRQARGSACGSSWRRRVGCSSANSLSWGGRSAATGLRRPPLSRAPIAPARLTLAPRHTQSHTQCSANPWYCWRLHRPAWAVVRLDGGRGGIRVAMPAQRCSRQFPGKITARYNRPDMARKHWLLAYRLAILALLSLIALALQTPPVPATPHTPATAAERQRQDEALARWGRESQGWPSK